MRQEKTYLVKTLKEAGAGNSIFTSFKRVEMSHDIKLAGVTVSGETLVRSGSKIKYMDAEGRRKSRHKLWDRITKMRVVIADSSDEKVEEVLEKFLRIVGKGLEIDQNWVTLEVGELDWVDEKDSILKAKVAVQFDVTFTGGIYEDYSMKPMGIEVKQEA